MSVARKRKHRLVVPPEVGANATFNDWLAGWVEIRVSKLGISETYGITVEGTDKDGKRRSLPLSRMVEEGRAIKIGHGKWDVEMPDGKVTHLKSKKAAVQFCQDNAVVFTEVST